jgi:geranylgeranyl diphosphate synthase, type III
MEGTGSFEYTKKVVRELRLKAINLITEMDGGSGKGNEVKSILDKIADSTLEG